MLDKEQKRMIINKWMVYFKTKEGHREGNEYIFAKTREEAIRLYHMYFNVDIDRITAIPVIGTKTSNAGGLV